MLREQMVRDTGTLFYPPDGVHLLKHSSGKKAPTKCRKTIKGTQISDLKDKWLDKGPKLTDLPF